MFWWHWESEKELINFFASGLIMIINNKWHHLKSSKKYQLNSIFLFFSHSIFSLFFHFSGLHFLFLHLFPLLFLKRTFVLFGSNFHLLFTFIILFQSPLQQSCYLQNSIQNSQHWYSFFKKHQLLSQIVHQHLPHFLQKLQNKELLVLQLSLMLLLERFLDTLNLSCSQLKLKR